MKKIYFFILLSFFSLIGFSQDSNQNPNHKKAFLEYSKIYKELIFLQATTLQETYKAYDYMELKEEEKQQRRYWRHLERLAYNSSPKTYLNSWGWNYDPWWNWNYGWDGYRWNDWGWNSSWRFGAYW